MKKRAVVSACLSLGVLILAAGYAHMNTVKEAEERRDGKDVFRIRLAEATPVVMKLASPLPAPAQIAETESTVSNVIPINENDLNGEVAEQAVSEGGQDPIAPGSKDSTATTTQTDRVTASSTATNTPAPTATATATPNRTASCKPTATPSPKIERTPTPKPTATPEKENSYTSESTTGESEDEIKTDTTAYTSGKAFLVAGDETDAESSYPGGTDDAENVNADIEPVIVNASESAKTVAVTPTATPKPTATPALTPTAKPEASPTPTPTPAVTPVRVPTFSVSGSYDWADLELAARVAYFEAGTSEGRRAVLNVIYNRCRSKDFGGKVTTVETEVYRKSQFSVVRKDKFELITADDSLIHMADDIFNGGNTVLPEDVVFFRAESRGTAWEGKEYYGTIGGNAFFRKAS